jgi:hypothetical protein
MSVGTLNLLPALCILPSTSLARHTSLPAQSGHP